MTKFDPSNDPSRDSHRDDGGPRDPSTDSDLGSAFPAAGGAFRMQHRSLEGLATFDAQIAMYDDAINRLGLKNSWRREFEQLSEVAAGLGNISSAEKARIRDWSAYRNCHRKRVGEFAGFPDLTLPLNKFSNPHLELSKRHPITRSALSCPITATQLSDDFFEETGILDFASDRGDPKARLQKKSLLSTSLAVQLFLDSLEPLEKKAFRMHVVTQTHPKVREWYPQEIKDVPTDLVGKIAVFSERSRPRSSIEKGRFENSFRSLGLSFYQDLHSLHRRHISVICQYHEEAATIGTIRADLEAMKQKLVQGLKKDTPQQDKDALKVEAKNLIAIAATALENCVDQNKILATTKLKKAINFKDSLGRDNESIALNSLSVAANELMERLHAASSKKSYIGRDCDSVEQIINGANVQFKSFREALERAATMLDRSNREWKKLEAETLSPSQFMQRMRINFYPTPETKADPYYTFVTKIQKFNGALLRALSDKDIDSAKTALENLYVVAKIHAANTVLQAIKLSLDLSPTQVSGSSRLTFEQMVSPWNRQRPQLEDLRALVNSAIVFSSTPLSSDSAPSADVSGCLGRTVIALKSIDEELGARLDAAQHGESLSDSYDNIRQFIEGNKAKSADRFNFLSLAKAL